jgi:hypothetical protein
MVTSSKEYIMRNPNVRRHIMKNLMVRTNRFTRFTARLAVSVLLAAILSVVPFHAALAATAPDLGTAGNFAVLGGPAVTLTNSVVNGDVGSGFPFPDSVITQTDSTINGAVHEGDQAAVDAYADLVSAWDAFKALPNGVLLTGTLAGVTLAPGSYYFDAAATLTGTLTLDAAGYANAVWIFKIGTSGTGALTGTGFSVVMANNGVPCNVFWWVAEAATMTTSNFQGTILAGAAITVTGGTFKGNALAQAAVTLTGTTVAGCKSGVPVTPVQPPIYDSIKVTGGGQISVPKPDSNDPDATGTGKATFGFNAQPDKSGGSKGEFNYVNHITGLHINGKVNSIVVIIENADGSPKTVLFSGTYNGGSFIVTVQDNDEPGRTDQFGVILTGSQPEVRNMRIISNGNIQFHK